MTSTGEHETTIAAISTPPGAGGIGIIRVSGEEALPILSRVFRPARSGCSHESHRLYYGHIIDPEDERPLDEVLAVYMQAPRTYTREDVVEIHCHGGFVVLQAVLELILRQGAELARPGEFTKRAFLNGRIDLTRAEAVIDILSARTRKGVDLAMEQMSGALFRRIDALRRQLVNFLAVLEVAIDFPEEEVEIVQNDILARRIEEEVLTPLAQLILTAANGRIVRDGASIVIVGLPNVGKSSLLNAILQEERALVAALPGTTRDTIEEYVDIQGIPARLVDTAGIREEAGEVEQLGIKRARESVNRADLVLFLVDGSRPLGDDDRALYETIRHKPTLTLVNKHDLEQRVDRKRDPQIFAEALHISALTQDGLAELRQELFSRLTEGREQWQEEGCTPNLRHKAALERAHRSLALVREGLLAGLTNDLIAVDLLDGLDHLGEIIGETTTEDVLDVIFEQFCLGK